MLSKSIFNKDTVYTKYDFPRVIISGSQICCGFRPCYLDKAQGPYNDHNDLDSPYTNVKQVLFGMCYFSKHLHLHQRRDRAGDDDDNRYTDFHPIQGKGARESLYTGGTAVNFQHWKIDHHRALLFTHRVPICDQICEYIQSNNLGSVVRMPNWTSKMTYTALSTLLWFWNGVVPTPESAGIKDFPFDAQGNKIPGRTNLRDKFNCPVFNKEFPIPATSTTSEVAA